MNGDARRESVTSQALKASGTIAIAAGGYALAGGKFDTDQLKENYEDTKGNVKKWAKDNNVLQGKGNNESISELKEKLGKAQEKRKKTFNNANVVVTRPPSGDAKPTVAKSASANKKKIAEATEGAKVLKAKLPEAGKRVKLKMK